MRPRRRHPATQYRCSRDEAQLIDDNPLNEIIEKAPEASTNEPRANRQTPPPLDGFRTETPGWAKIRGTIETTVPMTQPPPPPDLDAIPNELSDVDIPAWALPRQRDDQAAGGFATNIPGLLNDDALLAGDPLKHAPPAHGTSARSKAKPTADENRPSTAAVSTTDLETSVEPEDIASRDVHIVGEYSAGKLPAPRSSLGERPKKTTIPVVENPPVRADIDTAHAEPRAVAVEPASAPGQGGEGSETPTWFEQHSDPVPESSRENSGAVTETTEPEDHSPRRFPGLFDPAETAPIETAALIGAEGSPPEPAALPATDTAMEWDLEAPSDADTILDAQRDPMDPTAPISDRVFSALADTLVLTTIAVLLMFGGASAAGTGLLSFVQAAPVPFAVAWLIFGLGYGILFVGTCGQTLGKMAMRIRVIGSDRFRVGYGKAAVRTLGYAAAMLTAGLGLILALKDAEHRALHDRLSGTRVVKA